MINTHILPHVPREWISLGFLSKWKEGMDGANSKDLHCDSESLGGMSPEPKAQTQDPSNAGVVKTKMVKVLHWPCQHPDLNPTENLCENCSLEFIFCLNPTNLKNKANLPGRMGEKSLPNSGQSLLQQTYNCCCSQRWFYQVLFWCKQHFSGLYIKIRWQIMNFEFENEHG